MKRPIAIPMALLSILALAACSSDDDTTGDGPAEARITFTPAEISTRAVTRGTQTTASTLKSYGVSCSIYGSDASYASAATGSYFYNQEIDASTGKTDYYWPGSDYKVSFFAYAPYGNSNITVSDATTTGRPTYTYTVPDDISSQIDFMTGEATDIGGKPSSSSYRQPLAFSHRCTGIAFNLTNNYSTSIQLKSISICGLRYTGSLTGDNWTLDASTKDYTITSNSTITAGATLNVTEASGPFLILPQSIASGAEWIRVVAVTDGSAEKTFTYSLPSQLTLAAGQTRTYNLSVKGNEKLIVDEVTVTDWSNGTTFAVNSYGTTIADWTKQE